MSDKSIQGIALVVCRQLMSHPYRSGPDNCEPVEPVLERVYGVLRFWNASCSPWCIRKTDGGGLHVREEEFMLLSNWQKQKINLLADYQDSLSELYTYYSVKFPDYQDFWLDLALPKLRYADWLRLCLSKIEAGAYRYNMMRFTVESVKSGLDYLKAQVRNIWHVDISHSDALAMALSIESGLISSRFYEIVDPLERGADDIVDGFKMEMRDHVRMIREVMYRAGNTNYQVV